MPLIRTVIPVEVVSKGVTREKHAGFAEDPVSGVSRPANIKESWALYEFEMHARQCAHCHQPYEVYRERERLCERGHRLAQEVAVYLYNQGGETLSTQRDGHKYVRVEIPETHNEVRGLLKAIERSLRHTHREPFVSQDRSYYVAARVPERHRPIKVKVEQPQRPRSGEIVNWPKVGIERRATIDVNNSTSSRSKRGSLYDADIAQQRRDYAKYNVEVREPSKGSSGYYR